MQITLTGYRHGIYSRMALLAKGADFAEIEVNPFSPPLPSDYPHPFGRVPVLTHGTFTLYETSAITRYVDLACPGPPLVPDSAKIADGLAAAPAVLAALDAIAAEGLALDPVAPSLADCHLAPMIAAFAAAKEGAALLSRHHALGRWWANVQDLPAFRGSGRDHMAR